MKDCKSQPKINKCCFSGFEASQNKLLAFCGQRKFYERVVY